MNENYQSKIILDLCGGTGSWSQPYNERVGYIIHNITLPNFDILNTTFKGGHLFFWAKKKPDLIVDASRVYGILSAPPCNQFSFARTNAKKPREPLKGLDIVIGCLKVIWYCQAQLKKDTQKKPPLRFWALENPNGMLKWFLGKPAFEFDPYDFGDNYKKKTYLWGWFNEPIKNPIESDKPKFDKLKTKEIASEWYGKLTRQERRAITPQGFAEAFFRANQ